MKKNEMFVMNHDEVLEFLKEHPHIAVVHDPLSKEEADAAIDLIREMVKNGILKKPGYIRPGNDISGEKTYHTGFMLYECRRQYCTGMDAELSDDQIFKEAEFAESVRMMTSNAVFYFDKGEGHLPYDGRLMRRLREFGIPVFYLLRVRKDNGSLSWDFYRYLDYKTGDDGTAEYDFGLIGELETYQPSEDELMQMKEPHKKLRSMTHDELSDREFAIAERCLHIKFRLLALMIIAAVRMDEQMRRNAESYLKEESGIWCRILGEPAGEQELRNIEAKLDFLEADISEPGV